MKINRTTCVGVLVALSGIVILFETSNKGGDTSAAKECDATAARKSPMGSQPLSAGLASGPEDGDEAMDDEMMPISAPELAAVLPDLTLLTEEEANDLPGPEGGGPEAIK